MQPSCSVADQWINNESSRRSRRWPAGVAEAGAPTAAPRLRANCGSLPTEQRNSSWLPPQQQHFALTNFVHSVITSLHTGLDRRNRDHVATLPPDRCRARRLRIQRRSRPAGL